MALVFLSLLLYFVFLYLCLISHDLFFKNFIFFPLHIIYMDFIDLDRNYDNGYEVRYDVPRIFHVTIDDFKFLPQVDHDNTSFSRYMAYGALSVSITLFLRFLSKFAFLVRYLYIVHLFVKLLFFQFWDFSVTPYYEAPAPKAAFVPGGAAAPVHAPAPAVAPGSGAAPAPTPTSAAHPAFGVMNEGGSSSAASSNVIILLVLLLLLLFLSFLQFIVILFLFNTLFPHLG